jgi:hypothetical protein
MTKPCDILATPGYGAHQAKVCHCSQAVRMGNRIETSGQGDRMPETRPTPTDDRA